MSFVGVSPPHPRRACGRSTPIRGAAPATPSSPDGRRPDVKSLAPPNRIGGADIVKGRSLSSPEKLGCGTAFALDNGLG